MIFFDLVFLGFYYLLDIIQYRRTKDSPYSFGAKDHAVLDSSTIHCLNLQMLLGELFDHINKGYDSFNLFLLIAVLIYVTHYLVYIKGGRLERLKSKNYSDRIKLLYILITLCYSGITIYLFVSGYFYN